MCSIVVYCFRNTISPHHLFLNSHRRSSNMPSGFRIGVRKSWEESSVKYIICTSTLTKETYLTVITLHKTLQPTNNVLLKYFFINVIELLTSSILFWYKYTPILKRMEISVRHLPDRNRSYQIMCWDTIGWDHDGGENRFRTYLCLRK